MRRQCDSLGLSESDSIESGGVGERLGARQTLLNSQGQMGLVLVATKIPPDFVSTPSVQK